MNWESVSRFGTWKFRTDFIFVALSYLSFILLLSFRFLISVILSVLTQRVSNIGPRNSLNVLLVLLSKDFIRKIVNPGISEIILGKPEMSQCPRLPRQVLLTICRLLRLPHYPHLLPLASHNPAWYICSVTQSRLTPWDSMDCSPQVSSVHGIFQARILERVAISSSRGYSWPRGSNLHLLHWQAYSLQLNPSPTKKTLRVPLLS